MSNWAEDLLHQYRNTGIILDINMFLLHFVGSLNPQIIPTFKRTDSFAIEDFYTLQAILAFAPKVVTTPNILTEVSNLLGQLPDHQKLPCFDLFAAGIEFLDERYLESKPITLMGEFRRFGITDAGLMSLAKEHLIVTIDFPLSNYLSSAGINVLNFNHIRDTAGLLPIGRFGGFRPPKRDLFGAAFCQRSWQKAAPNERFSGACGPRSPRWRVSQQYHPYVELAIMLWYGCGIVLPGVER